MLLTLTFSMLWNWIWQERPSQLLTLSIPLLKRVLEVMVMLMLSFLKVLIQVHRSFFRTRHGRQPFWLKPFTLKTSIASVVGQVFFCCVMPRGWSKAPFLDGWVQIIRGPRPKSEQWPKAGPQSKVVTQKRSQSAVSQGISAIAAGGERHVLPHRSTSRPPEAVAAEKCGGRAFVGNHRSVGRKQSIFDPVEGSPPCCTSSQ